MRDIGDMDPDLVIAVIEDLERECIIEVLCIGRVYRESKGVTEILSFCKVRRRYLIRNAVCCVCHLSLEPVRQGIFSKDCMHLSIIGSRLSEHIHDMAHRVRLVAVPMVNHSRHLHSLACGQFPSLALVLVIFIYPVYGEQPLRKRFEPSRLVRLLCKRLAFRGLAMPAKTDLVRFCKRDCDVIRHETALHQHPRLVCDNVKHPHKRFGRTTDNLYHFSFATLGISLVPCHSYDHRIPVQSATGLGCLHKNVIFLSLHNHEYKTLTGHLNSPLNVREYFLFAASALS